MINKEEAGISWVAFDPGDLRHSRKHFENEIKKSANELGLNLKYLVTQQLSTPQRHEAYVAGFSESNDELISNFKNKISTSMEIDETGFEQEVIELFTISKQGRLAKFPTNIESFGKHSVSELIANTAIEQVLAVGQEIKDNAIVNTFGYVRPVMYEGKLTLFVEANYTGEFSPIEKAEPHRCCGEDH